MKNYFSKLNNFNRYSKVITSSKQSGPAQSMLYALGLTKNDIKKPQIGIGAIWYESNPCNSHIDTISNRIKNNFINRDLLGFRFNSIGVSDGISMGTSGMNYSLLSRELIADNFETICRAHHYDGLISIPGCDKNLPGVLIAMIRLNRPSFIIYGGAMRPNYYNNKELDIVSAFESYGKLLNNEISENEHSNIIENACNKKCGSCSGLYTANTMAAIFEVMGITLPNSSSNPANSKEKMLEASKSYDIMYNLIKENILPSDILTREAFINGIKMLYVTGGSTNAIIHLMAIAKNANVDLTLDDFNKYNDIPVLLNMKPHGKYMMYHLHKNGGMSFFIKYLIDIGLINGDLLTITGKTLRQNVKDITYVKNDVIYNIETPFKKNSHIKILKGNLAPKGSISKIYDYKLKKVLGKVKVYYSENDMIDALTNNKINSDNIILILGQGETIGCPEMLKPTSALVGYFGNKLPPLLTDGRFSGGSKGVLVAHLEDMYKQNSITGYIKDNDEIEIDFVNNSINLLVSNNELNLRKKEIKIETPKFKGVLNRYSKYIGDIDNGYLLK
jgi:dihydroxy-acid dehydratase